MVMPTLSVSPVTLIFRLANMTSMLIIIAMSITSHSQVVFFFEFNSILEQFLQYRGEDRDYGGGEDEDQRQSHEPWGVVRVRDWDKERDRRSVDDADGKGEELDLLQNSDGQGGECFVLVDITQQSNGFEEYGEKQDRRQVSAYGDRHMQIIYGVRQPKKADCQNRQANKDHGDPQVKRRITFHKVTSQVFGKFILT